MNKQIEAVALKREIEFLENQLANGEITKQEFQREIRELRYDLQASAEERAQAAYNDVMGEW